MCQREIACKNHEVFFFHFEAALRSSAFSVTSVVHFHFIKRDIIVKDISRATVLSLIKNRAYLSASRIQ